MVILSGLQALLTGEMEVGCYASGCLDMELETLCPKTVHLSVLLIPRQRWPYARKSSGNPAGSALVSFYLFLSVLRWFCFHLCSFAHLMFGCNRLIAFIRVCSPLWYPRMEGRSPWSQQSRCSLNLHARIEQTPVYHAPVNLRGFPLETVTMGDPFKIIYFREISRGMVELDLSISHLMTKFLEEQVALTASKGRKVPTY